VQFSQEIPNITDSNRNLFSSLKNSATRDDFDRLTRELLNITPAQAKKISDDIRRAAEAEEEVAA
jgi:chromosome partitioning protein